MPPKKRRFCGSLLNLKNKKKQTKNHKQTKKKPNNQNKLISSYFRLCCYSMHETHLRTFSCVKACVHNASIAFGESKGARFIAKVHKDNIQCTQQQTAHRHKKIASIMALDHLPYPILMHERTSGYDLVHLHINLLPSVSMLYVSPKLTSLPLGSLHPDSFSSSVNKGSQVSNENILASDAICTTEHYMRVSSAIVSVSYQGTAKKLNCSTSNKNC